MNLLSYNRAVESGDLDKVEKILEKHKNDKGSEEDESDVDGKSDVQVLENGVKNEQDTLSDEDLWRSPSKIPCMGKEKGDGPAGSDTKICVEMVDLKEEPHLGRTAPQKKRRFTNRRLSSVGGMWQKAASSVTSPLPVSLAKQSSFQLRPTNTLDGEAMDSLGKKRKVKFNKNCKDQWGRSALFIAMIHQNLDMLELLLHHKVSF